MATSAARRELVPVPARESLDPESLRRSRYLANVAEILACASACTAAGVELPELTAAICTRCGQVGRSEPLHLVGGLELRRWRWRGRNALGDLVHPVAVTQARHLRDAPTLCPDHEGAAIAAGTVPAPELRLELDRVGVRP